MSRLAPISVEADPASTTRTNRVRALNDDFRRNFAGGHVMLSRGIAILPEECRRAAEATVQSFEAFSVADDPDGEHDFGALISLDGDAFGRSTPTTGPGSGTRLTRPTQQ